MGVIYGWLSHLPSANSASISSLMAVMKRIIIFILPEVKMGLKVALT